jgi:hypothetical protein
MKTENKIKESGTASAQQDGKIDFRKFTAI